MTNDQIPNPNECPITKSQLDIGDWDFIGYWDLVIGI